MLDAKKHPHIHQPLTRKTRTNTHASCVTVSLCPLHPILQVGSPFYFFPPLIPNSTEPKEKWCVCDVFIRPPGSPTAAFDLLRLIAIWKEKLSYWISLVGWGLFVLLLFFFPPLFFSRMVWTLGCCWCLRGVCVSYWERDPALIESWQNEIISSLFISQQWTLCVYVSVILGGISITAP